MKRILLLGLLVPVLSWASGAEEAAVQKIEDIQKALKAMSLQGAPVCDISSNPKCEFQSYCSAVAPNRKNAYIYDKGDGSRVANYNLLLLQDQLAMCLAANGKKADRKFANESDPFANPHLLYGESGKKYDERFKTASERAKKTGDDLKKRITVLLEKKRNSENSKIIDNMISRIQRVKISTFKPKSADELYEHGCFFPNAFFSPMTNEVTLCPQMLDVPEGTLDMVLAHELGHAIDPCSVSLEVMKDSSGAESLLPKEWATGKLALSGVRPSKNPFGSAIQCLQTPESMDIKRTTNAERHAELEEFLEDLRKEGADDNDSVVTSIRNQMRSLQEGEEENYCSEFPEDPKVAYLRESFADWMSTEVIASKLKETKDPAKAKSLALESQLMGLQMECGGFNQDQKESIASDMQAAGCRASVVEHLFGLEKGKDSDAHQGWDKRISKIFLAQPEMQKALGCEPQKETVLCK